MINSSAPLAVEHDLHEIEALQVPTKAVNAGFQVLLSLANLVIWLSILPISQILLPTQIAAMGAANKFTNLAIATTVGVLAAVITNPIAGALSDRTTSRLGRRRPWFLVGSMFSAVTLALIAHSTSFVALVLWWAIFHISANWILAGISRLLPDPAPFRQASAVSA